MNNERMKKLESVTYELVTNFIFQEMAEESLEFGLITVTWIKISSDLSYLDIYVSALKNEEKLTKTLAAHATEIQRQFNKSLSLRKFPRIRFRYDDTWAVWEQVSRMINDLDM